MIKKILVAFSALILLSTASHADLFGRTKPVYNIHDAYIQTTSGEDLTLEEVQDFFIQAASYKGWTAKIIEPGHIVASITVRRHFAQIDVTLSPTTYSIVYKDSRELKYNGEKIHRNYNKWIKLLDDQFRLNLTNH